MRDKWRPILVDALRHYISLRPARLVLGSNKPQSPYAMILLI